MFICKIIKGIILCKKYKISFKKVEINLESQKKNKILRKIFSIIICAFSNRTRYGIFFYHQKQWRYFKR